MKKRVLFLSVILAVITLLLLLFLFFYQSKKKIKEEIFSLPELKDKLCSQEQKKDLLEFSDPKKILNQDLFVSNELEFLRDYYFCQGLINKNQNIACNKNFYLKEEEFQQCQQAFYFSRMMLALWKNEKKEAVENCKKTISGQICDLIANQNPFKEGFCQQIPSDQQKICFVVFEGKEEYCQELEEKKPYCLAMADLSKNKIWESKNQIDKCNRLNTVGPLGRSAIVCKLYFTSSQSVCQEIYNNFLENFCPN